MQRNNLKLLPITVFWPVLVIIFFSGTAFYKKYFTLLMIYCTPFSGFDLKDFVGIFAELQCLPKVFE